jgi:tRNA (guanine-N7-)-methyltransferase
MLKCPSIPMRPEQFFIPDFNKEAGPRYHDRLLFVPSPSKKPSSSPDPQHPPLDWNSLPYFDALRPLAIEYCAGNGQWISHKAISDKNKNWIAVERKMDRAKKIWSKIKNHQLDNLLCLAGEALFSTKTLFPDQCVQEVYINFPDPWPKKRHHKNRLLQPPFLDELSRIMVPSAHLMFVTDCPQLSDAVLHDILVHPHFNPCFPLPYYTSTWPDYGNSYFETLWLEKGRTIRYHLFERRAG